MDLKRLVEEDGWCGAVHALADAIVEVADEGVLEGIYDEGEVDVMRIIAQRLRDVVGPY